MHKVTETHMTPVDVQHQEPGGCATGDLSKASPGQEVVGGGCGRWLSEVPQAAYQAE